MNTKEVVTILNNMSISDKIDTRERAAINEALFFLAKIEHKDEQQYDFQGWPLEQLTMKQLRKFVRDNGALDDDVKLLVLEDDGMGYGARNGYCTDLSVSEDEEGKKEVQIWF